MSDNNLVPIKNRPQFSPGKNPWAFTGAHDPRNGPSFDKGDDPRRHVRGQVNPGLMKFRVQLRQMMIEEGLKEVPTPSGYDGPTVTRIQRVVERIFDEAELGEAWACQLIFDRIDGKAPPTLDTLPPGDVAVLVVRGASTDEL